MEDIATEPGKRRYTAKAEIMACLDRIVEMVEDSGMTMVAAHKALTEAGLVHMSYKSFAAWLSSRGLLDQGKIERDRRRAYEAAYGSPATLLDVLRTDRAKLARRYSISTDEDGRVILTPIVDDRKDGGEGPPA